MKVGTINLNANGLPDRKGERCLAEMVTKRSNGEMVIQPLQILPNPNGYARVRPIFGRLIVGKGEFDRVFTKMPVKLEAVPALAPVVRRTLRDEFPQIWNEYANRR